MRFWRLDTPENLVCDSFPLWGQAAPANGCFIMTVTHLVGSWLYDKSKLRLKGFCYIDLLSRSCIHLPTGDRVIDLVEIEKANRGVTAQRLEPGV